MFLSRKLRVAFNIITYNSKLTPCSLYKVCCARHCKKAPYNFVSSNFLVYGINFK